jgi:hypothetical protein
MSTNQKRIYMAKVVFHYQDFVAGTKNIMVNFTVQKRENAKIDFPVSKNFIVNFFSRFLSRFASQVAFSRF